MINEKIPKTDMPNAGTFVYEKTNEPFVDIVKYSEGAILAEMKYAEQGRTGAITVAYVRKRVAEMLMQAKKLLPDGYTFKIYDAWRPYAVQKSLYDEYFNRLKEENPSFSTEELHVLAKKFVSYPDKSGEYGYVHSTGGAVDLTVVAPNGRELDMGTGFDDFSALALTASFEDSGDETVKKNRRILYHAMRKAGFTNYPNEWWHYDYGDCFYATLTGDTVKYSSVYLLKDVQNGGKSGG